MPEHVLDGVDVRAVRRVLVAREKSGNVLLEVLLRAGGGESGAEVVQEDVLVAQLGVELRNDGLQHSLTDQRWGSRGTPLTAAALDW